MSKRDQLAIKYFGQQFIELQKITGKSAIKRRHRLRLRAEHLERHYVSPLSKIKEVAKDIFKEE